MLQAERGDRQHRHARLADQERVLVGAVQRAAVLEDPQPPGRGLLGHAVVEDDHAVRDVLLDAVAGQRPVAPLAGDHRRDPAVLEPARTGGAARERRIAVFENAPNSVSIVSITTRLAPTASIAAPRRRNSPSRSQSPVSSISPPIDVDVVDHELAVGLELREVEAQRGDVGDQVVGATPRRRRTPRARRTRVIPRTRNSIAEQRLAAARRTADQRRPPARQPAAGHLVEPADARRRLRQHPDRVGNHRAHLLLREATSRLTRATILAVHALKPSVSRLATTALIGVEPSPYDAPESMPRATERWPFRVC